MTTLLWVCLLCYILSTEALSHTVNDKNDKSPSSRKSPNIFFILIDDLGWNDISLHGGCDYQTANLDALAEDGLELSNYYVQHLCTPTRHSLMSGRYPIHDGMQEKVIDITMPYGMPLSITTLPQMLKRAGYKTHIVGKWHLGMYRTEYTPTRRGFDSHVGYWSDSQNYYEKNHTKGNLTGMDFRHNLEPYNNVEYSTDVYQDRIMDILTDHVSDPDPDPFFLYYAAQAVHLPWQAPGWMLDDLSFVTGKNRRTLAGVVTYFDRSVGAIVNYMKSEESGYLWDDTLIIVSSDNGGDIGHQMSNFPLRGGKSTLWEGGIRATAFVTGGVLPDERRGHKMNALMHVSDWFPTLCALGDVDYKADDVQTLDGFDQLDNILSGETNKYIPREMIVHNMLPPVLGVDLYELAGAIRWRNWKIVAGKADMKYQKWVATDISRTQRMGDTEMTVQCSKEGVSNYDHPRPSNSTTTNCPLAVYGTACLFNIEEDPCEWVDQSESEPLLFSQMMDLLVEYNRSQVLPTLWSLHPEDVRGSNPKHFDGYWSPWMDDVDTSAETNFNADPGGVQSPETNLSVHHSVQAALVVAAAVMVLAVAFYCSRAQSGKKRIWTDVREDLQPLI